MYCIGILKNQLTQIAKPDGTTTKFIRNLAGDITNIQYGSGQESYQYNANGDLISRKDATKRMSHILMMLMEK